MRQSAKKQINLRLSPETLRELSQIATLKKVSQADVVSVLVHLYTEGEDLDTADSWFDIVRMS